MPFVKLDTGILDSSLWSEPSSTRICWITLLAMADATGLVRATAPGIANRANLGVDETRKALEVFESPDPNSRSTNDDGRKIRRVDGGYEIINYMKYREIDYTAAERMRRFRLRRNERNQPNKTVTLRKQKQIAEADTEEESKGKNPLTIPSLVLRAYGLFHRRETTQLSQTEKKAWKGSRCAVESTTEHDWLLLEWAYGRESGNAAKYRRKDLATLLNNWNAEIDRARQWKSDTKPAYRSSRCADRVEQPELSDEEWKRIQDTAKAEAARFKEQQNGTSGRVVQ